MISDFPAFVPLMLTLKVALFATVFAFLAGVSFAYIMVHTKIWGRDLIDAIVTLPLVLPPTVLGYYLLVIFGRNGWLGQWLQELFGVSLIFTWQGAVVASAIVSLPLIFKSAKASFESIDATLENAARTLGHSEVSIFLKVSFPLAWRGIMAGVMLAFARAMGEFGATLMIAGNLPGKTQTLSVAVYQAVQAGDDALANTLVVITSCVSLFILYTSGKLLNGRQAWLLK
jgi:molybdate transport system permease protein